MSVSLRLVPVTRDQHLADCRENLVWAESKLKDTPEALIFTRQALDSYIKSLKSQIAQLEV